MKPVYFLITLFLFLGVFLFSQNSITFQQDDLNRLSQTVYSNGVIVQYCYDQLGNRTCKIVQVTVPPAVDLTFSNTPAVAPTTVGTGSNTTLNGTLNNTGTGVAGASLIKYYLSSNSTLGVGDTLLAITYVNAVAAAGTFGLTNIGLTIPANTASGTYYIIVVADGDVTVVESNENNNIAVIPITVVNCNSLSLSISAVTDTCALSKGKAVVNATGGSGNFAYSWNTVPVRTTPIITGLSAGFYSVTVTDNVTNCSIQGSAQVGNTGSALTPGFTYSISGLVASFQSNAVGANAYNWNFGNGGNSVQQNPVYTYTTAGNYNVCHTATNICGTINNCTNVLVSLPPNYNKLKPIDFELGKDSVTITYASPFTPANLSATAIAVSGEITGFKQGSLVHNANKLFFIPNSKFSAGEKVHVTLRKQIVTTALDTLSSYNWIDYAPVANTGCGGFDTLNTGIKFSNSLYSYNYSAADFNKDGQVDLLIRHHDSYGAATNLKIYFRNANGSYQPAINYSNNVSHSGLVNTPDLNNDGYPDIVVAHNFPSQLAVWLNNGNGTFTTAPSLYTLQNYSNGGTIADVNNDGFLDFVGKSGISSLAANRVSVRLNNGNGTLGAEVSYTTNSTFGSGLEVADINLDGRADIFYTSSNAYGSAQQYVFYKNDTTNSFAQAASATNTPNEYISALRDVDMDGYPDALLANPSNIKFGNGTFIAGGVSAAIDASANSYYFFGDVNGDGLTDAVGYRPDSSAYRAMNNGSRQFVAARLSKISALQGFARLTDLDSDGDVDFFYANTKDTLIYLAINTYLQPVVASASDSSVCPGGVITLSASAGFDSYLWSDGQTGRTINVSSLPAGNNNLIVTAAGCGSISIDTVLVFADTIPAVSLTSLSSICKNAPAIILTGLPAGGIYTGAGVSGNQFNPANAPTGNQFINYTYSNSTGCSNSANTTVTVIPLQTPDITIQPNKTTACAVDTVVFTANIVNGGLTPVYQWQKNGTNVGTSTVSYTAINPLASDVFRCILTSNASCASPVKDTSNNISITVVPSVTPTISIAATNVNYCTDQLFSWAATTTNAGANPTYQWYVDGNPVGTNSVSYSTPNLPLFGGSVISCVLTSSASCASPLSITSNTITTPAVVFQAAIGQPQGAGTACIGDTVTYTVTAGGSTSIIWSVTNGLIISGQGTTSVKIVWQQAGNNEITVIGTNICGSAIVNQVKMVAVGAASDITIATFNSTVCDNTSPIFTATVINAGTNSVYQWKLNGQNAGSNANTYTLSNPATGNLVSCIYSSTNLCSTNFSDTSNAISITTIPAPSTPVINMNPLVWCGNSPTNLQVSPCNSCSYQWSQTITTPIIGTVTTPIPGNSNGIPVTGLIQGSIINVTVTSANGCSARGSTVFNAVQQQNSASNITASICQNSFYNFNGTLLSSAGIYTDTVPSAVGCDSIITLTLAIKPLSSTNLSASICQGEIYVFKGQNLSIAGVYRDTLISSNGCDSIITLNLSVSNALSSSFSASICSGGSYPFNNQNLAAAGVYKDTLIASGGCDSIVTLNLSVNNTLTSSFNAAICSGGSYPFNNQNLTAAGVYKDTLIASGGCDSIVTLNLSVSNTLSSSFSASICSGGSYPFNNQNLTAAGAYKDTLIASGGCDSVITLNLSVSNALSSSFSASICSGGSYSFNNQNLTAAGIYKDTLIASGGCDSVVILNLIVNVAPDQPLITVIGDTTFCLGDSVILQTADLGISYLWSNTATSTSVNIKNSGTYHVMATNQCGNATSGDISVTAWNLPAQPVITQVGNTLISSITASSYQWYFNQSFIIGAITKNILADQNGNYQVEITDTNGCKNTSALYNFTTVGIAEKLTLFRTQIIPNPNNGQFTIQFSDNEQRLISITDVIGQILLKENVTGSKQIGNRLWADGVYFVNVYSPSGTTSIKFIIAK